MSEQSAPTPTYTEWIGRTETVSDVASRSAAIGLASVLDRPLDAAETDRSELLPTGHWLQFTPTAPMNELGADGHPKLGAFMPPLDLPRRMWAGSKLEYHSPITVGQTLDRVTTIESITPKTGSSGRLCFVVLRHDVQADGVQALTERQSIVYREPAVLDPEQPSRQRPPRVSIGAPEGWDWVLSQQPLEATLFRYSALTFNAHRIHYDLPYATREEGYPGLVVHGPLLATYLVEGFLHTHPGAHVSAFEFSARAPIFCGEQIHVVGRAADDTSEELAIIAPDGGTALTARLSYR
ncbi:MaoC family dehydratase N-terminal domain-containing protein [Leucobacter rhizosphaerae]|uniref:MaoC family dehydratase N-terminal domain-containing protein n=1 Tax=Leucobacter rhizosphaerae TaxID=2932245 RepID=A0ABY4FU21_9MICO|nr:MaoC family dehydratase N-terminal domain-containing protein [Leucobacter rhizosphaerae]UOQ59654.1 MaoC family dehydratase N-terminal domain-containing protein [Leucobacter rhizosphaerae]